MKKELTRIKNKFYCKHSINDICEECRKKVRGDVSGISGNVSGISGNVTGISGDVSGISGNVDDCELTAEDRKKGVDIQELVKEKEK